MTIINKLQEFYDLSSLKGIVNGILTSAMAGILTGMFYFGSATESSAGAKHSPAKCTPLDESIFLYQSCKRKAAGSDGIIDGDEGRRLAIALKPEIAVFETDKVEFRNPWGGACIMVYSGFPKDNKYYLMSETEISLCDSISFISSFG